MTSNSAPVLVELEGVNTISRNLGEDANRGQGEAESVKDNVDAR